jgi:hypothetical protein
MLSSRTKPALVQIHLALKEGFSLSFRQYLLIASRSLPYQVYLELTILDRPVVAPLGNDQFLEVSLRLQEKRLR